MRRLLTFQPASVAWTLSTFRRKHSSQATSIAQEHPGSAQVHPDLLQLLEATLLSSQDGRLPLAALYDSLPSDVRKMHVRPHKSLLNALRQYEATVNAPLFRVADDGISVELSSLRPTTTPTSTTKSAAQSLRSSERPVSKPTANSSAFRSAGNEHQKAPLSCDYVPPNPLLFQFPSVHAHSNASSSKATSELRWSADNDFYFGVTLMSAPPSPPAQIEPSKATMEEGLEEAITSSLNVASFASYIPLFFVSVAEVAQALPEGYTEEHIDHYLASVKTIQIVKVAGVRYMRIFGGFGQVNLDGAAEAAELFSQYRPDPTIAPAFEAAFDGVYDKWMPLPMLLSRTDVRAVERLPFKGPAAILYFAQMQHMFSFTPEGDGSVLLRPPKYSQLGTDNSPVPYSISKVIQLLPLEGFVSVDELVRQLPEDAMNEIRQYFPSMEYFVRSHGSVLYTTCEPDDVTATGSENCDATNSSSPNGTLKICRAKYKERIDRKALPLHEQLEIALQNRRKKDVRSIRRKIALLQSSDSPLTDRETLAKEIYKALPRRGHAKLKTFMRGTLPDDILNFMPKNYQKFFAGFPELFQTFELHQATNWCIARAGQPLPRGVVKKDFTDEEILRVIAQYVSRAGARSMSTISLNIPHGAMAAIRLRHSDLFNFVRKFPENFSLVLPIDQGNAKSAAVAHLMKLPEGSCDEGPPVDDDAEGVDFDEDDEEKKL